MRRSKTNPVAGSRTGGVPFEEGLQLVDIETVSRTAPIRREVGRYREHPAHREILRHPPSGATEGTLEWISPELVLVDPELARAERARLVELARLQPPTGAGTNGRVLEELPVQAPEEVPQTRASERQTPSRWSRERVTPVLLTLSLMANAILTAVVVADIRNGQPNAALPPALVTTLQGGVSTKTITTSRPAGKSTATTPQSTPTPQAQSTAVRTEASAAVERKILALVVRSPTGKLPPALIDRSTGLAKNNLQAVCRATSSRAFLCVVRPTRHKPTEGLYARYRTSRNGKGVFTWYPYQHG
jgi:hypothetical protein